MRTVTDFICLRIFPNFRDYLQTKLLMRILILLFFAALLLLASCVPNRKVLYLQHQDELKKKLEQDTAVRKYSLMDFNYKIQTNDIISVRYQSQTAKEFDFMTQQNQQNNTGTMAGQTGGALLFGELVDERGEIPVPVLGKVKVAGLTIFQIQDTLQRRVNFYLESTIVKVRLLNYRATLLGEVLKEGSVTFNNNRVSLMEAIGLAGGLSQLADRSHVKLIRQRGSVTEVHYINLLEEDFMKSPFYYVYQNDIILVPPLKVRPYRLYFNDNLAVFLSAVSVLLLVVTIARLK